MFHEPLDQPQSTQIFEPMLPEIEKNKCKLLKQNWFFICETHFWCDLPSCLLWKIIDFKFFLVFFEHWIRTGNNKRIIVFFRLIVEFVVQFGSKLFGYGFRLKKESWNKKQSECDKAKRKNIALFTYRYERLCRPTFENGFGRLLRGPFRFEAQILGHIDARSKSFGQL